MTTRPREPFVDYVDILHGRTGLESSYAAEIPAIKSTQRLKLHPKATFFVGEHRLSDDIAILLELHRF